MVKSVGYVRAIQGNSETNSSAQDQSNSTVCWEEAIDPHYNRVYYYNVKDRRSTWTRPELEEAIRTIQQQKQDAKAESKKKDNPVWIEAYDPSLKRSYYFQPENKRSTWTRPQMKEFQQNVAKMLEEHKKESKPTPKLPPPTENKMVITDKDDWEEYFDPTYKQKYYFNRKTHKSTWIKPLKSGSTIQKRPKTNQKPSNLSISTKEVTKKRISTKEAQNHNGKFNLNEYVKVQRLQTNKFLNGMCGIVIKCPDVQKDRTVVKIGGKKLSLRNVNLVRADKDELKLVDDYSKFKQQSPKENKDVQKMNVVTPPKPKSLAIEPMKKSTIPEANKCVPKQQIKPSSGSVKGYIKLLRRGVPRAAVDHQMRMNGLDPSELDAFIPAVIASSSGENTAEESPAIITSKDEEKVVDEEIDNTKSQLRAAFQSSLSSELGKVVLRKASTVSTPDTTPETKTSGIPWLDALRNNPKFTAIRQASLTKLECEE